MPSQPTTCRLRSLEWGATSPSCLGTWQQLDEIARDPTR